jgi:hypothetical protein
MKVSKQNREKGFPESVLSNFFNLFSYTIKFSFGFSRTQEIEFWSFEYNIVLLNFDAFKLYENIQMPFAQEINLW